MSAGCAYEGCTVGETGLCALERDPATCSYRVIGETDPGQDAEDDIRNPDAPVLDSPDQNPTFPASTALPPNTISEMMAERYVTVVGILGDPDAGKTACLTSLCLLVANAQLEGWSFADSRSLMAFEDIARGARRWNEGDPPQQMTVHTEMADERQPGFLHLRLKRCSDGRVVDFALPDLPGEWTKAFIRSAVSDRLDFLRAADVVWLVTDGRALIERERRQGTITRLGQLAARLGALWGEGPRARLLLVITHKDRGEVPQEVLMRVEAELAKHRCRAGVFLVAPFSEDEGKAAAGSGLPDLLLASASAPSRPAAFWPPKPATCSGRQYLSYRND